MFASVFPGGAGSNNTDVFHYVDGILEGETGTTDEPINTSIGGNFPKVILGARRQGSNATPASTPGDYLDGMLDDVRIYDHALTESEIVALAIIPEPSSVLLAIMALPALAATGRRRRRRR